MCHITLSSDNVSLVQAQAWSTDFALISKGNLKICLRMTLWCSTFTTATHKHQGEAQHASLNPICKFNLTHAENRNHSNAAKTLGELGEIQIHPDSSPSGEVGFRAMSESLGWAKRPMLQRVHLLPPSMPVTMLYGAQSWVDSSSGERAAQIRKQAHTKVLVSRHKVRRMSLCNYKQETVLPARNSCYWIYIYFVKEKFCVAEANVYFNHPNFHCLFPA